jgi:hypothetical protein
VASSRRRLVWTFVLPPVAYAIARLGRSLLDWALAANPSWAGFGERVGGWLIGLVVVLVVVLPLLKIYGLSDHPRDKD